MEFPLAFSLKFPPEHKVANCSKDDEKGEEH